MPKTILVIEDEPAILAFTQETLEKAGFAAAAWTSGRGVLEEIAKVKPSALFLDVMLPGFDGYTLLMKISASAALKTIPVVVMSAEVSTQTPFDKFPQVAAFLKKPFNAVQLLAAAKLALP